jgi:hypothetical protein
MRKFWLKLIFILNVLFYWFILYILFGFLFEHVLSNIFANSIVILNLMFIISIFVLLLPISVLLTHLLFKYVRSNY